MSPNQNTGISSTFGERFSWWLQRWHIAHSPDVSFGRKFWCYGELFCAGVTLITLGYVVTVIIASELVAVPKVFKAWPLQILLAGAVGYGTNFLAIQMLFKPRRPFQSIPLRWIWKQGLIPAKQLEMAETVGEEVASRLLTSEAIVEELSRLIQSAMEDRAFVTSLQSKIHPLLQDRIPGFVNRFFPETLDAIKGELSDNLPVERLKFVVLDFIETWFSSEQNRSMLAQFILNFFQNHTDMLVEFVVLAVKKYKKTSTLRAFSIRAGVAANIINFGKFENILYRQFDKPKTKRIVRKIVENFSIEVRHLADQLLKDEWLEEIRQDAGEAALQSVKEISEQILNPALTELMDSKSFRTYVHEEIIPNFKKMVLDGIKEGRFVSILEQFDVRGKVSRAMSDLNVNEIEDMVNRVGAYHFGPIQVLGYIFGLMAGVLIVLLNTLK